MGCGANESCRSWGVSKIRQVGRVATACKRFCCVAKLKLIPQAKHRFFRFQFELDNCYP